MARLLSVNYFPKKYLIQGLVEGGAYVRDIGLGPTPMLYFSCFENDCEQYAAEKLKVEKSEGDYTTVYNK